MAGRLILWIALALSWLSILLGLPGTLLMLLSAVVYGWATGFQRIGGRVLVEGGFVGRIAGITLKLSAGALMALWVYRILR
jgi:hypothetical protein